MEQATAKQTLFGVCALALGGIITVAAHIGRDSWVPEFSIATFRAGCALMVAAGFWIIASWITSLRDVNR